MLVICVREPERYVDQGNALIRYFNKVNLKTWGTPILIAANILKIEFSELLKLVERGYEQYSLKD